MDAAVALDRVFHLNERVSSALTLPADLRETPAGQALIADAARKVADLDVAAEFGLRLPRRAWVVLIPATTAALAALRPGLGAPHRPRHDHEFADVDAKAIAKQTEMLTKKIASQRQAIDKEKFPEADKLLAKIEKKAQELAKAPPAGKDKLMVELNSLTDALKERQKQLGSPEQVNRQLQQLKEMANQGPADQFAKDLAKGDFKKAAEQLQKLQEKLQSGKMTEAEKKALKEQLGEMAKKLNELANLEQRKKQLEEARKNGGLSEQQFQREMDKLNEQTKSLKQLQQLASKLGKAAESLQKGDTKKAAESLGMSQEQIAEMAKQLEEMESLDSAMAELQDAKNGMAAGRHEPAWQRFQQLRHGLQSAQGHGQRPGPRPRPGRPPRSPRRDRHLHQQGQAAVEERARPFRSASPRRARPSKGTVIDIQGEIDAGTGSVADALSNQKIPKNLEKHIRSYYDQLNKGN